MNSNNEVLLFALQSAKDSPVSLTAANYIGAYDIEVSPYEGEKKTSNLAKAHDGHNLMHNANPHMAYSFKVDLPMMLVADVNGAPVVGELLKNTGHEENIVTDTGSEHVNYSLIDSTQYDAVPFATMEYYKGNILYTLNNARGELTGIEVSALGFITLSFSGFADYTKPAHVASLPSVDRAPWEKLLPVNAANTPVAKAYGRDCILKTMQLSPALSSSYKNYVGSQGARYQGGSRQPTLSLGIEAEILSDYDAFAQLESHTGTVVTGGFELQHGTESGNNFGIKAPRLQLTDVSTGDDEGLIDFNFNSNILHSNGNDEYVLIFNKFIA